MNSATWRGAASFASAIPTIPRHTPIACVNFTEVRSRDGGLVDASGLTVEDFGLSDNLMMIHALDLHGCALLTPRQAPADIWRDLTAFENCVRMAAERLAP